MSDNGRDRSDAIDRYLLTRIASGDEEAFTMLYQKYNKVIYASALEILTQREEVDEAVQDAFYRVWTKAHLFDPDKSRPFSWIYTVSRRVFLNHRSALYGKGLELTELLDIHASDVGESRTYSETREHIQHYLEQLPEPQQECLRMALFKGLTFDEIALHTGKPIGSVKTWIRRGLLILRKKFKS